MNILVLGGTRFFGKRLVWELIKKGYKVTIATRGLHEDEFGDQVTRIQLDRMSYQSMKEALEGKSYDIVYDNLCYASHDVKNFLDIMKGHIGKYIVTSSLATYDKGFNMKEEAFNPFQYNLKEGDRGAFTYGEGKRMAEAMVYQRYDVPTIAVRFPVVIGLNDYTKRLEFYIKQVALQQPFTAKRTEEPMSFITEEEAGEFLAFLAEIEYTGPINACCDGETNVKEIIEITEQMSGKKADLVEDSEYVGEYTTYGNATLNNNRAKGLGYVFKEVHEALKEVILESLKNNYTV